MWSTNYIDLLIYVVIWPPNYFYVPFGIITRSPNYVYVPMQYNYLVFYLYLCSHKL